MKVFVDSKKLIRYKLNKESGILTFLSNLRM